MHVHWNALFGFGFIFWLLLCLNELLGGGKSHKYFHITDLDEIYDKEFVENLAASKVEGAVENLQQRGIKFGLSLLVWNSVAFVFSIVFCSLARTISWILWKIHICYKNSQQISIARSSSGSLTDRGTSRIPVMIKSNSTIARSSDTNIKLKQAINSDNSCPNLTPIKRSSSSISQNAAVKNCQTLFKNSSLIAHKAASRFDRHLDNQCTRLREEMIKMQANSLREHAMLSKKIEAIAREKRELSKLLTVTQKENRAAKQQLDELLQERTVLIKRLENASKEFKCNTKTKKFALAKLEEATAAVDDLKQQLEQVTRDKEILENKLRVLECEYEKLQERLILNQTHDNFGDYHEHTPERDMNGKDQERTQNQNTQYEGECNKNPPNISTVSQTELDMKKIEMKIKQLERNLENFNATKSELNFPTADKEESDLSLSVRGNHTETQLKTDDEGDVSENPFLSSPRFRYWGGRAGDLVGRRDQFAKIQALATKMHEKVRLLENIKESCESTQGTDVEDYSSPESMEDIRQPKRIVSSSAAFQNFLKSLHSSESMKRQFGSQSDLYF